MTVSRFPASPIKARSRHETQEIRRDRGIRCGRGRRRAGIAQADPARPARPPWCRAGRQRRRTGQPAAAGPGLPAATGHRGDIDGIVPVWAPPPPRPPVWAPWLPVVWNADLPAGGLVERRIHPALTSASPALSALSRLLSRPATNTPSRGFVRGDAVDLLATVATIEPDGDRVLCRAMTAQCARASCQRCRDRHRISTHLTIIALRSDSVITDTAAEPT